MTEVTTESSIVILGNDELNVDYDDKINDLQLIEEINIKNPCDEPILCNDTINECTITTQEDAMEQFLGGDSKNDFLNEDSMPSIDKNRFVEFKSDNVLDFLDHDDDIVTEKKVFRKRKNVIALALKKRSIKM